ncbi:M15 family metallopeptidase [Acetonema longum]|uniref:D-alanyl-D-alanine dipeptidase n=1 Tax=Acetonema longum DSM 6540 TaxID=1009370 RepID=F7NIZ2_9FIRM|nr:M15 family metallopeptidase [Acetonema longum]EGO63989.1 putative D-alanyl-D-alanine dipeptidase [Acetonema longum DSM 6540]
MQWFSGQQCLKVMMTAAALLLLPPVYSLAAGSQQDLVKIQNIDPAIYIDMRYAGIHNFTGRQVYTANVCVLRRGTAEKLARANAEFAKRGFRLKIWDAYRPLSVQKIFWKLVPDRRYVANPQGNASRHNRGTAVDVTLVDEQGRELIMPSEFDDFSYRAQRDYPGISPFAQSNAAYLAEVMEQAGFRSLGSEWWHFDDADWTMYPVEDIPLENFL